jgi:hypothetical protein
MMGHRLLPRVGFVVVALGHAASVVGAGPAQAVESWGLPLADFTSDSGLGLGAMGGIGWYEPGPLGSVELDLYLYGSTGGEQYHALDLDLDGIGGGPMGLSLGGGYSASQLDNYCGSPGEDACAGPSLGHRTAFRHSEGFGYLSLRWRRPPSPFSVFGGWAGTQHWAGVPREPSPWPDSLYAERFPEGEEGFSSTLQAGLVLDTRDDEAEPSRGVWADASVRGGAPAWGSDWSFAGGNLTLRGYAPLGTERLTSATRLGLDLVAGEQPTSEQSSTGGVQGYGALGGAGFGRGIRYGRYRGQVKALGQQELRAQLLTLTPLEQRVSIGGVAFVEGGWIAARPDDLSDAAAAWSTGVGLRVGWRDFMVRADLGLSPAEDWAPYLYVDFDHVF